MKFDPNLKIEDDSVATIGTTVSGDFRTWYYVSAPGMLHRKNGPAMESEHGGAWYYLYGKSHRIGGPARTFDYNNEVEYWLDDVQYETEEEYLKACKLFILK